MVADDNVRPVPVVFRLSTRAAFMKLLTVVQSVGNSAVAPWPLLTAAGPPYRASAADVIN